MENYSADDEGTGGGNTSELSEGYSTPLNVSGDETNTTEASVTYVAEFNITADTACSPVVSQNVPTATKPEEESGGGSENDGDGSSTVCPKATRKSKIPTLNGKRILVQTQTRNCTTMLEKYKELKNRDSAMNATFDVPDLLQSDAHGNEHCTD